jgi:hypothetical protein
MTVAILKKEMGATTRFSNPLFLSENGWRTVVKQTEFGDYNDNLSVYLTALYAMRRGFRKEGLLIIQNLRSQIVETGEAKSNEWLLPKLNSYLTHCQRIE